MAPFLGLSLLFWALVFALNPVRDFLYNDDWIYYSGLERLVQGGRLALSHAGSPTHLVQVLWAAPFCGVFGVSTHAARISTLVAAWICVLIVYALLVEAGSRPREAAFGALALLFNPLFLVLSFTFMNDVHGLAWLLAASYLLIRAAKRTDVGLACASLFSGIAYLVRQTGIFAAAGAAVWLWRRNERSVRRYAAVLAPALAVAAGHILWTSIARSGDAFRTYAIDGTIYHLAQPGLLIRHDFQRIAGAGLYLGLFLWPAYQGFVGGRRGAAIAVLGVWLILLVSRLVPETGNTIGRFGLGTCTLGSSCAFKPVGVLGSSGFWVGALLFGALGSIAMATRIANRLRSNASPAVTALFFAFIASLAGALYFDRYALPLMAAVALLCCPASVERRHWAGLCLISIYSIAGTLDFLNSNEARWMGALDLRSRGYNETEISAGFDWAYYYGIEKASDAGSTEPSRWQDPVRKRAFVSYAPASVIPTMSRIGEVGYWTPLTWRREALYLWIDTKPQVGSCRRGSPSRSARAPARSNPRRHPRFAMRYALELSIRSFSA